MLRKHLIRNVFENYLFDLSKTLWKCFVFAGNQTVFYFPHWLVTWNIAPCDHNPTCTVRYTIISIYTPRSITLPKFIETGLWLQGNYDFPFIPGCIGKVCLHLLTDGLEWLVTKTPWYNREMVHTFTRMIVTENWSHMYRFYSRFNFAYRISAYKIFGFC